MNTSTRLVQETLKTVRCPYCHQNSSIVAPENYAPVYAYCSNCGEKFIVERLARGMQVLTIEEAPCCSDPDCRAIEMGASDEQ